MSEPLLTVVMPTYNRRATLEQALIALEKQTLTHDQFELVVVNDGSNDDTETFLARYVAAGALDARCYAQENRGPAAARNRGVREARGWIILFIGDDVRAAPNLLEHHLGWHRERPADHIAVLGLTTWDPHQPITPFMRWLETGGPQYKFWAIHNPEEASYHHFYTSNVSVKRQFLLEKGLFDEDFPYASHDDTELALRLERQGMRLTYNSRAVGYHDHYTSLASAVRRMGRVGESQRIFLRKSGKEIPVRPPRSPLLEMASRAKFRISLWFGEQTEKRWVLPHLYSYLMDKALWEAVYGSDSGL